MAKNEKTTSLKKCPPWAIRTAPIKVPVMTPAKNQNLWRLLTPNIPKEIKEKPTAACPLTNEQLVAQKLLGVNAGTK
jgi:hypothetical protein